MLVSIIHTIKKSKLLKSSVIYTFSSAINSAIPFLFLPILTRILSPEEYGILAMFQICVSIIVPLVGLNLEGAIARKYYEDENSNFSSFVGAASILSTLSTIFLLLFFFIFSSEISILTKIPETYIVAIVILAYLRFIMLVLLTVFQVKIKPFNYGVIQVLHSALSVGVTMYLLFYLSLTWEARILGQIYAAILIAIVSLIILRKNNYISLKIMKSDVKYAISFGGPLIPHAIGSVGLVVIDRFFLTELIGLEATGFFTIAYQLGAVISLITISFNNAFVPWLFENLNKNDFNVNRKIVKITYTYFISILAISLFLIVFFPSIMKIIIGQKFHSIDQYSFLIIIGFSFQGLFFMVTNYLYYVKKTYLQSLISFSIIGIKIPITYFAIKKFGISGAAWSFLLTYFLFFIITWIISSKIYPMPWNLIKKRN